MLMSKNSVWEFSPGERVIVKEFTVGQTTFENLEGEVMVLNNSNDDLERRFYVGVLNMRPIWRTKDGLRKLQS